MQEIKVPSTITELVVQVKHFAEQFQIGKLEFPPELNPDVLNQGEGDFDLVNVSGMPLGRDVIVLKNACGIEGVGRMVLLVCLIFVLLVVLF